ncbi:hypothetical protein PIB30_071664 [Stylosanthes scabra]|uniref:Uncharacterized protein n=1 Tax=Stylosanthes scabra TaxID=79078 RepID=A0ABU6RP88_9FABA|nr:hypothetical protein [Stylosanthes scabra]
MSNKSKDGITMDALQTSRRKERRRKETLLKRVSDWIGNKWVIGCPVLQFFAALALTFDPSTASAHRRLGAPCCDPMKKQPLGAMAGPKAWRDEPLELWTRRLIPCYFILHRESAVGMHTHSATLFHRTALVSALAPTIVFIHGVVSFFLHGGTDPGATLSIVVDVTTKHRRTYVLLVPVATSFCSPPLVAELPL